MGDNLAELLYWQYFTGRGWPYGSDEFPSWHNLKANERYAWEQVAKKAHRTMLDRVIADIACVEEMRISDGDDVCAELRRRFGR